MRAAACVARLLTEHVQANRAALPVQACFDRVIDAARQTDILECRMRCVKYYAERCAETGDVGGDSCRLAEEDQRLAVSLVFEQETEGRQRRCSAYPSAEASPITGEPHYWRAPLLASPGWSCRGQEIRKPPRERL
jgi:hypothetical protein